MKSGLFSIGPAVRVAKGQVVASTHWLIRLLSLGSLYKELRVTRKMVVLDERMLWFIRRIQTFRVSDISHLTYEYHRREGVGQFGQTTYSEQERYSLSLVLRKNQVPIKLFEFWGDAYSRGHLVDLPQKLMERVDTVGMQSEDSLELLVAMRQLTGLTVGKDAPAVRDANGALWRCSSCGRESAPRPGKCLYCGGECASG